MTRIYTLGHSNMGAITMAELLQAHDIKVVVDVRSHPTSRWEQHRHENLSQWLPALGVEYKWRPRLGGWTTLHHEYAGWAAERGVDLSKYSEGHFPKDHIAPDRPNPDQVPSWTNQGLYDYSWFLALDSTLDALDVLQQEAEGPRLAIMCAEILWWKCHRSMIADYLVWAGCDVTHLQPRLTDHESALGNRLQRYSPEIKQAWINH